MFAPYSSFLVPFGLFHILFAHFRQLYLVLHLLFVAKSVTYILLTNSRPVFRSSGCSSIVVWSSTATSPIICWQVESTWIMMVVKSSVSQDDVASSSTYTDYWEGLTTSQADLLLANSELTAKVFLLHFPSIERKPKSSRYGRRCCRRRFVSPPLVTIDLMLSHGKKPAHFPLKSTNRLSTVHP